MSDGAERFYEVMGYSPVDPEYDTGAAKHDRRLACIRIERLNDEIKKWKQLSLLTIDVAQNLNKRPCQVCEVTRKRNELENS